MKDEELNEIAETYFVNMSRFIDVDVKINLRKDIKQYITREKLVIELKLDTDADFYSSLISRTLQELDYFKQVEKSDIYILTEEGKEFLRRIKERSNF